MTSGSWKSRIQGGVDHHEVDILKTMVEVLQTYCELDLGREIYQLFLEQQPGSATAFPQLLKYLRIRWSEGHRPAAGDNFFFVGSYGRNREAVLFSPPLKYRQHMGVHGIGTSSNDGLRVELSNFLKNEYREVSRSAFAFSTAVGCLGVFWLQKHHSIDLKIEDWSEKASKSKLQPGSV